MVYRKKGDPPKEVDLEAINQIDWTIPEGGAGSITRCDEAKEDNRLCMSCFHAVMNHNLTMAVGCNRRVYALKHLWIHMETNDIDEWEGHAKEKIVSMVQGLNTRGITERESGVIKMANDNSPNTKPSKGGTPQGKTNTNIENMEEEE